MRYNGDGGKTQHRVEGQPRYQDHMTVDEMHARYGPQMHYYISISAGHPDVLMELIKALDGLVTQVDTSRSGRPVVGGELRAQLSTVELLVPRMETNLREYYDRCPIRGPMYHEECIKEKYWMPHRLVPYSQRETKDQLCMDPVRMRRISLDWMRGTDGESQYWRKAQDAPYWERDHLNWVRQAMAKVFTDRTIGLDENLLDRGRLPAEMQELMDMQASSVDWGQTYRLKTPGQGKLSIERFPPRILAPGSSSGGAGRVDPQVSQGRGVDGMKVHFAPGHRVADWRRAD